LILVAAIVVATAWTDFADANLYIDVQYASGGESGSSPYLAYVDASHETFTLNVYALITDPNPSSSVDQFKTMTSNFFVASSVLKGDVSFNSFSNNISSQSSVAGTQFTTSYGALGLGGSATTLISSTAWWYAYANPNPLNGSNAATPPTTIPGIGVEYYLGQLTVTFTGYTLPSSGTAAFQSITPNKWGVVIKPDQWIDNLGSWTTVWGSASNVGGGAASGNLLTYPAVNGAGLQFQTFTSNLVYSLSAAAAQTLIHAGGTTTATAAIMNQSNSGSLSYTGLNLIASAGTLSGAGLPKDGGPFAAGTSDNGSQNFTATTPGTITLAPTVSGVSPTASLGSSQGVSISVFSGSAAWYGGSGSWGGSGANPNWTDTVTASIHAAPGVWGFAGDSAALTSGTAGTVTLDGPVTLASLSINNSSAGYTLAAGSGGTLHAYNGNNAATVAIVAGNHSITAPVVLDSNTSVTINNPGDSLAVSGLIGGSGGLTKLGPGMLALSGSNTYSGNTVISAGLLQVGNNSALGAASASLTINGGTLDLQGYSVNVGPLSGSSSGMITNQSAGAASTLVVGNGDATSAFGGSIADGSGGIAVTKVGTGIFTLAGNNSYTGTTSVTGGTLVVQGASMSPAFVASNNALLEFSGSGINLGTGYVRAMTGGTVQYQNASITGGFLRGPYPQVLAAGFANSFGTTTINAGALIQQLGSTTLAGVTNRGQFNNSAPLNWVGGINDGGATLTVGNTATVSQWTNAGAVVVTSGGVLNNHQTDLTSYGGGQITVNSGGTLNADSQNEFVALDLQASLLVNNGTVHGKLNVGNGSEAAGSGTFDAVDVSSGGTLALITTAAGPMTLNGLLTGSGMLTKTGSGSLILSGTANTFNGLAAVSDGRLIVSNPHALGDGTSLSVGNAAAFPAAIVDSESVVGTVAPVPEPGTLVLLAAALSCAAIYRRSRSARA